MPDSAQHYHLTLKAHPIEYRPDPLSYFSHIHELKGAILLDSGTPSSESGRFDLMSALPVAELMTDSQGYAWSPQHPELPNTPIKAQRALLKRLIIDKDSSVPEEIPFHSGLMGAWSYNFGRYLEELPHTDHDHQFAIQGLPLSWIGLYTWVLVQDHHTRQSFIIANEAQLDEMCALFNNKTNTFNETEPFKLVSTFSPIMAKTEYKNALGRIKHYIEEGDCYQVNLTHAFRSVYKGCEWQAYQRLRKATQSPFSAYLRPTANIPFTLVSVSPERFVSVQQGTITAQPIKGTRPRGHTPEEDQSLAQELENSSKDLAENIMIVDLLRNDIGRVANPGSIRVTQLAQRIAYANVHHLVSTIEGQLAPDHDAHDLLGASLPGGSITGAPKHRAMEIIDEVEASERSYYCGSIGYIDYRGNMDTSITIRTAVMTAQEVWLWGGGGIVSDSVEEEEYEESLVKIQRLMTALEA